MQRKIHIALVVGVILALVGLAYAYASPATLRHSLWSQDDASLRIGEDGNISQLDTNGSFVVNGYTRNFVYAVSAYPAPTTGRPLVIHLHGDGGNMGLSATWKNAVLNDANGAVLLSAQGRNNIPAAALIDGSAWRFRMDETGAPYDDVDFIDQLITNATVLLGTPIDPHRVYVVGESRGAGFAYVLYADPRTRNKIRAIVPISGTFYCDGDAVAPGTPGTPAQPGSDTTCGEVSAYGYWGPKASLFSAPGVTRAAHILDIHGQLPPGGSELPETAPPALDSDWGSPQWAGWGDAAGCYTVRVSAQTAQTLAQPIGGRTVKTYTYSQAVGNLATRCANLDLTFYVVQGGGHVPGGFEPTAWGFLSIVGGTFPGNHLVPWLGGNWYLSGVNVPWQPGLTGYGSDFGTVEEWGGHHTYSSTLTAQMFTTLKASGANTVRWWVFTDGRGAPEFDSNVGGAVTGLDANFLPSLDSAVKLADQYDIYLVFTLWDFGMLDDDSTPAGSGEHAGGHRDLIVEAAKRQSFINNALRPMLQHPIPGTSYTLGTHPHILAWEIINEPEWGISESGAVDPADSQPVSLVEMQRFVAEIAAAIRQNSNQLITLGSASIKWNSDTALGAAGNWWSDADLTPYAAAGYLDFYQVHYYGWMNGDGVTWSYSPLFNTAAAAGFDKPVVIGEFPANANGLGVSVSQALNGFYNNGYAGAWAWSYEDIGEGGWADSQAAYGAFNTAHTAQVNIAYRLYLPLVMRSR